MNETLHILEMLEEGTISADEAHQLLTAVRSERDGLEGVQPPAVEPASSIGTPNFQRYRLLSYIPLAVALAILVLCSWGTYLLYRHSEGRLTVGLVMLIIVTALALLLAVVALWMSTTSWLHVRIRDGGGRRIAISLPLPLMLADWGLHLAQRFVDNESTAQLGAAAQLVHAVRARHSVAPDQPISIDVDDGGERVQVYIG